MSDLISRAAAINALMDAFCDTMIESICKDTIEALPSAQPEDKCGECDAWNQYKNYPRPRWIPCSERLPENDTRVIVWMAWGGFSMLDYQYNHFYGLNSVNDIPNEAVAAWMPLPEPYRKDGD